MKSCKDCGSWAINPREHGREPGVDFDLCDVCYWRHRAAADGQMLDWLEALWASPDLAARSMFAVHAKLNGVRATIRAAMKQEPPHA